MRCSVYFWRSWLQNDIKIECGWVRRSASCRRITAWIYLLVVHNFRSFELFVGNLTTIFILWVITLVQVTHIIMHLTFQTILWLLGTLLYKFPVLFYVNIYVFRSQMLLKHQILSDNVVINNFHLLQSFLDYVDCLVQHLVLQTKILHSFLFLMQLLCQSFNLHSISPLI